MESAKQENYWTLDPGYAFALLESTAEHPKASWSPGKRHYSYPHIYAAPTEGVWFTDPGYQWLSPGTWDLRTFSPAQTWQAWQLAADIDASTHGIDCTSDGAVLSVIEAARDRFGALDTKDVHPLLAQHFANVQSALDRGATTINTCFVVNHAKDGADLGAAALCLFSSKTWQECMDDSATARKVIGVVGELGSVPCDQALKDFGQKLDELGSERQRLQDDFRARYDLQLTRPIRLVTCR
ncbi:MAG TPA: hypothetical protein VGS07_22000 [Thermoanaerobaculia bacterium]|jgi:hypothetical protein|nr:hypothetical protein [Thermoanaerobaculia bacterium]